MKTTIKVSGEELKERLTLLNSFYTHSKIYYYGNYVRLTIVENTLYLMQVNIVGEAINSGMIQVSLKGTRLEGQDIEVMIPAENIKPLLSHISKDFVVVEVTHKGVSIVGEDKRLNIPVVESEIPEILLSNTQEVSQGEYTQVDFEAMLEAINVVSQATKGVVVDYANQAIYLENNEAIVNKGVRITRHLTGRPLGLAEGMLLPLHVIPTLKLLKGQQVHCMRAVSSSGEDLVMFYGDSFAFNFQEWYSKSEFPIEQIKQIATFEGAQKHDEYINALSSVVSSTNIIEMNFREGIVRTNDGEINVKTPILDLDTIYLGSEVTPKATELRKSNTMQITPNFVKFVGDDIVTVVGTMEKQD